MSRLEKIQALYKDYLIFAERLEENRKPGDGIFGIGRKPADDSCHDRFAEDLKQQLADYAAEAPDPKEVREVLYYIYRAPKEHLQPLSIYWMLISVHGFTEDLIGLLDPADAGMLLELYNDLYPRWDRLPAQKRIYKALKSGRK